MTLIISRSDHVDIPLATNDCESIPDDEEDSDKLIGSDEDDMEMHQVSSELGGTFKVSLGQLLEVPPIYQFSTMSVDPVSTDWIRDMHVE